MVLPHASKPIDVGLPPDNPNGLPALAIAFLTSLRVRGYAESTIEEYQARLRDFLRWCDDRSLSLPTQITIPIVERQITSVSLLSGRSRAVDGDSRCVRFTWVETASDVGNAVFNGHTSLRDGGTLGVRRSFRQTSGINTQGEGRTESLCSDW